MNYEIKRKFHHKGYVFLLSVTSTAAFWSAHKFDGDKQTFSLADARFVYQIEHNKQIEGLIKENEDNEPAEFKDVSVMDITKMQ